MLVFAALSIPIGYYFGQTVGVFTVLIGAFITLGLYNRKNKGVKDGSVK